MHWIVGTGDTHFELFGDKHNIYEVTENSLFIFAVIWFVIEFGYPLCR